MSKTNFLFNEGDIYKTIQIGEHIFELKYGYYTESDRLLGEPYVIFPRLAENPLYDSDGNRIVSAIQNPCEHYQVVDSKIRDECCVDCIHYSPPGDDIGICMHYKNTKQHVLKTRPNESV